MQIDCKRRRYHRHIPDPSPRYHNNSNPRSLLACNSSINKISHPKQLISERDWSILPADVLLVILGRLQIKDYLRFGAVCVSWNRAAATRLVSPARSLPWLMVDPIFKGPSLFRAMLNPFTGKEDYRIKLHTHNHFIGLTSNGYIAYSDKNMELLIINPLTRSRITRLPSTTTLTERPNNTRFCITDAALLRRQHTTAVAIVYTNGFPRLPELAFSRPGDKKWTLLADSAFVFDMIFRQGRLYALHQHCGTMIWDIRGDDPPRSMPTVAPLKRDTNVCKAFLVESSTGDELFQVQIDWGGACHAIFKLQEDDTTGIRSWCRVTSLSVDDALMLSPGLAVCVSSRDFPALRRNCIYSTFSWEPPFPLGDERNSPRQKKLLHVYNLADGTKEFVPVGPYNEDNLHDWFIPSLS